MSANKESSKTKDRKVILSTLWIFAMFNYLYADVFSLIFNPGIQNMAKKMTEGVVLGWAVFMETAMAMVLLSRVLKYGANRWANIVAGVLHTAAVFWSLFAGSGTPAFFYIFFATIEITCTLFIVWYAWNWPNPADLASNMALDQDELGGNS